MMTMLMIMSLIVPVQATTATRTVTINAREGYVFNADAYTDYGTVSLQLDADEHAKKANSVLLKSTVIADANKFPSDGIVLSYSFEAPISGTYTLATITGGDITHIHLSKYGVMIDNGELKKITTSNVTSATDVAESDLHKKYTTNLTFDITKGTHTFKYVIYEHNTAREGTLGYFKGAELTVEDTESEDNTCMISGVDCNVLDEENAFLTLKYGSAWEKEHIGNVVVTDYFGAEVINKEIAVSPGDTQTNIDLSGIKRGHFEVKVNIGNCESKAYFAVVPTAEKRRDTSNSSVASDTAFTYLADKEKLDDYINALKKAGISLCRERIDLSSINSSSNQYNYTKYEDYINKLNGAGIEILGLITGVPSYLKENGKKFSNNLIGIYKSISTIAHSELFKEKIKAWEIYNEPDMMSEAPDLYAASLKAMSIGIEDAKCNAMVSTSGFAYSPGGYSDWLLRNDIDGYVDIYNMHHHQSAYRTTAFPSYQTSATAQHLEAMKKYNMSDKELWVSEAGLYYPLDADTNDLTIEQQKVQARYAPISALTSLTQGVDKHFWFVFPHYLESGGNYGSFSENDMPYSAYSAIAAMTNTLGNAKYSGELSGLNENTYGYVFKDENNRETVLAIWSDTEQELELDFGVNEAVLVDIMGNEKSVQATGNSFEINIGKDVVYLRINSLLEDTVYDKATVRATSKKDKLTTEERIVIVQRYAENSTANPINNGYAVDKNGEEISVDVYNFNTSKVSGKIKATAYGGWSLDKEEATVEIPARGKQTLTFTLSGGDECLNTKSPIVFYGEFNDKKTTESVSMVSPKEKTTVIPTVTVDNFTDKSKWTKSGEGTMNFDNSVSNEISFAFSMYGTWAYPFVEIGNADLSDTDGVCFELYMEEIPEITMRMIIDEADGSWYTAEGIPLEKTGWQQIIIPYSAFSVYNSDTDGNFSIKDIKQIRLGFNVRGESGNNVTYKVRNFGGYKENANLYSEINGFEYKNQKLSVKYSNGQIPLKAGSLRLYADGEKINTSSFDTTFDFLMGEHTFEAFAEDCSGRVSSFKESKIISNDGLYITESGFYDKNGKELKKLAEGDVKNARIKVGNLADGTLKNIMLIVVFYNGNDVEYTTLADYEIVPGFLGYKELEITEKPQNYDKIKLYCWTRENMEPINKVVEVE